MKYPHHLLLSLFLSPLFIQCPANAEQVPSNGVHIDRVELAGNGCQPGSAVASISPDRNELTLLFDNFISEVGGSRPSTIDKKTCNMNIHFQIPDGWSMSLASADYRGFIALDEGTTAIHQAHYAFTHSRGEKSFSARTLKGPLNENYYFHNVINTDADGWSQCNVRKMKMKVRVNLETQIQKRIGNLNPYGQITLDSVDTSLEQKFQVAWRPCTENSHGRGNGNRNNNSKRDMRM